MCISILKFNLGISGETHGKMTGKMLIYIESLLFIEQPDAVLVYGDTNTTLVAALATVKLCILVIHVEAGNRLGTLSNSEKVNHICTDHILSLLFCATEDAFENLRKEGLSDKAYVAGNIMYDSFCYFSDKISNTNIIF